MDVKFVINYMKITKQQISRAKSTDFLELIESLDIPYKQESGHIKMLCVWHEENTPSLAIYEDHCHCFACGQHSDIIGFVMQVFKLSFQDAVIFLNKANE